MIDTILILLALGLTVYCGVAVVFHVMPALPRWPLRRPRPYECLPCLLTFTDPRQAAWHQQAEHGATYDGGR